MKYLSGLILCLLCSCTSSKLSTNVKKTNTTKADHLIDKAIVAHGGGLYDQASYAFTFRGKRYNFTNQDDHYTYRVEYEKDGQKIRDQLLNQQFSRSVDGQVMTLSEKDITRYTNSLNSVIYFATLPYKLKDSAVLPSYVGTQTIKGKIYEEIEICFKKENGGVDFDDTYHYWINQSTNQIEYLAYNFHVNKGGVRFRTAYNPRTVSGIVFQDYINYKAPKGTPLHELPSLYEQGLLEEVSRIDTEDVIALK